MGIQIGPFYLDFTGLLLAANKSPFHGFAYIFLNGGWIPIVIALLYGLKWVYMKYIQDKYMAKWKWVLFAVDVPKDNIQSPKAVENIFAHLAGAHFLGNLIEKYVKGRVQEWFSFEIVSHEGYVRFYIRTTEQFRDLAEAAVYAQYPSAEIMEVDDYAAFAPDHFPNDEYNLWGTEFVLQNKEAYPIRTYPEFEHQLSQEFKDPMAALLESMSKISQGEHVWLQLIVRPTNDQWKEEGIRIAKKLVGAKVVEKPTLIEKALGVPATMIGEVLNAIMSNPEEGIEKGGRELISIMQFLTPGERRIIEALQFKISKIGFQTKFRMIYLAKKEVFHKGRGVSAIMGAIKQFNTLDLNGFRPYKQVTTKVNYFFVKKRTAWRQRKIMRRYKKRGFMAGATPYILNIEELASIFHFPVMEVRAPLVRKTESKRSEPPIGLPIKTTIYESPAVKPKAERKTPPENLPLE